jgi:hypothetical protein
MTRKIWPLLSFFLLLSGCGSVDWFPSVTAPPPTTAPTTFTAPTITAALSPTSIASGGSSTLTLTIHNTTANLPAQTGLQFQEQLPSGVTAANAVSNCSGTVETTSSFIIFRNGALTSGVASCTVTATLGATVSGTTAQDFVIKSADFTNFGGGLVSGVTNQTLTVTPIAAAVLFPTLSAAVVPAAMVDGGSSALSFTITNATGNPAQSGMGFTETLPTGFKATVATPTQCGGTLSSAGSNLTFAGGALAVGSANCTLNAELSLTTSNTIIADQNSSVKNADFSMQGTLVNGVTDQAFKVFPAAITVASAGVTVSNLIALGTADSTGTKFNFTFTADTSNTGVSAVNATVTVVGIDANGAQIASTLAPLSVSIPTNSGGVKTPLVDLNSTNPLSVPNADSARVSFWRLLTVTVP